MSRKVLLLGAASAIAQETAKLLAAEGDRLFLVARSENQLEIVARDLEARGAAGVGRLAVDLNDFARHAELVERATQAMDGLDTVIVAHGLLGDDDRSQTDWAEADLVIRTNFTSAAAVLTLVAQRFEAQGAGTIVGISSVAGDRGRRSNYVYGAAKGGFSLFLQGLRSRLQDKGVHVLTVKPGPVDTPMTEHLTKGFLFARASDVARGIQRAMRRRKDVAYLPWFWRIIMGVIVSIPEPLFKRMRL